MLPWMSCNVIDCFSLTISLWHLWYICDAWSQWHHHGHKETASEQSTMVTPHQKHSLCTGQYNPISYNSTYPWRPLSPYNSNATAGVEFHFGLRESKLILKFQLLHVSMEKLILISGFYENHCENRFSDSRRISSPEQLPDSSIGFVYMLVSKWTPIATLHMLVKQHVSNADSNNTTLVMVRTLRTTPNFALGCALC